MKFHEKLRAALLAADIEHHWRRILRHRRCAAALVERGEALNSRRMLRLNRRLARCGMLAKKKEARYEAQFVPPLGGSR